MKIEGNRLDEARKDLKTRVPLLPCKNGGIFNVKLRITFLILTSDYELCRERNMGPAKLRYIRDKDEANIPHYSSSVNLGDFMLRRP